MEIASSGWSLRAVRTVDALDLAEWCQIKKLNHTAAGLHAAAFAVDPKLADDLRTGRRDNAAALAKLPADEQKALTQLWADVAALLKQANLARAR